MAYRRLFTPLRLGLGGLSTSIGVTTENLHAVPADELWHRLRGRELEVHRIGDCLAPRRAHAATVEGERVGAAL